MKIIIILILLLNITGCGSPGAAGFAMLQNHPEFTIGLSGMDVDQNYT